MNRKALLEWYMESGVDEAIDTEVVNYFSSASSSQPSSASGAIQTKEVKSDRVTPSSSTAPTHSPSAAQAAARAMADQCLTLADLEAAVRSFDGCAIKK